MITIAVIIAAAINAVVILFVWASKQPMVKDAYSNDVQTSAPLEQKYTLKGDTEAGSVFFGEEAEIISNSNWQDVQKNN